MCVIAAPFVVMGCVQPLDPGPKASDGSNPMQDFTDMYGNGTYTHSKRHTFSEVGKDFDPFDLICHIAFESKPLTRKERADNVKKRNYFTKYGKKAQAVINSLLDKYTDDGLLTIESTEVLKLDPLNKLGTPIESVKAFGGKPQYTAALKELENELYKTA